MSQNYYGGGSFHIDVAKKNKASSLTAAVVKLKVFHVLAACRRNLFNYPSPPGSEPVGFISMDDLTNTMQPTNHIHCLHISLMLQAHVLRKPNRNLCLLHLPHGCIMGLI